MAKAKSTPKKTTGKKNNNKKVTKKVVSKPTKKVVSKPKKVSTKKVIKQAVTKRKTTKKTVKEPSKLVKLIKFIIALSIVGMLLYFVYINFIVINDNVSPRSNSSSNELEDTAKKKFALFNSKHNLNDNDLMFYTSKDLDIKTMDSQSILYFAYSMLSIEDKKSTNNCSDVNEDCIIETFDKKVIEEQIKNYLDIDNIEYTDFNATATITCNLDNNVYKCSQNKGKFLASNYTTISNYLSYKTEGNKLIVESTLLTIRRIQEKVYSEGIYKDALATVKIDNLDYFLKELEGQVNTQTTQKLAEKYEKQSTHYQTTFVLKNNNYVWQSTKIIK